MNILCFEIKYHSDYFQRQLMKFKAKRINKNKGPLQAVKYIKDTMGWSLMNANNYYKIHVK